MTRLRHTSEALGMFAKALLEAHKKGEVGSENLDVGLPDTAANLKIREGLRKLVGKKLTTQEVQELKRRAFDGGQVTDEEALYLLQLALDEDSFEHTSVKGQRELTESARVARYDLVRFAVLHLADVDPRADKDEKTASLAGNSQVIREYFKGTLRGLVSKGEAEAAYLRNACQVSKAVQADAAVSDLPVNATATEVLAVFVKQTEAIDGWRFLKAGEQHNVLVKPGINWGINGYPTVTSWESVYAAALATQEKGRAVGADVTVTVADESGIENKAFGRTTMDNMEDTGILGGAILAGLENSFRKSGQSPAQAHASAVAFISSQLQEAGVAVPPNPTAEDVAPLIRRNHTALIERAKEGGVVVIALDEQPTFILKPVAKGAKETVGAHEANMTSEQLASLHHFQKGIRVAKPLEEITDIINLPKPPGRHGIMSNCGLTGAVKNYIGLMSGLDRADSLHSKFARTPPRREDESAGSFEERIREFVAWMGGRGVSRGSVSLQANADEDAAGLGDWQAHEEELLKTATEWVENMKSEGQKLADKSGQEAEGPGQQFFEKLAELNLYFKSKERFSFTDMRKTVSSFGPDFGEQLEVGKAIASNSAAAVDILAAAELKRAYKKAGGLKYKGGEEFSELAHAKPGLRGAPARLLARLRDAMSSAYQAAQGHNFLRGNNPFKLKNHAAVMSYPGLAPTGMENIHLKLTSDAGVPSEYLGGR